MHAMIAISILVEDGALLTGFVSMLAGRIAISHAGVVDPLVFEADINALLAE
jgi:hypothetical protein